MTRARRVLVGVDTHTAVHCAVVLDQTGRLLGTQEFAASAAGYGRLHRWARTFGQVEAAGVEGTGAYGAGLARL